jgi:hypothetical protein
VREPYPAPLEAHPLSGCAKEPFHEGRAPSGTGLALAFRTLLSFQGTSPGCSSATRSRFPRHVPSPERRGRYHGPLEIVKDFPPDRSVLLAEYCPPRRHRHTEAPPRTRTVWASGRPPKAVGWTPVGFGDPLSSVADAAGVVPERSSVLKNFPACSLETVAPSATVCQLTDASNGNGSSVMVGQPKCRSGTS